MKTLRERLTDDRVHVLDGAMGTVLYNRGIFVNVCYDELNLKQPQLVRGVHEEYVRAGAEILETNTFGANPVKLSSFGLEEQTEPINAAAVTLAKQAARGAALVVGAIGPLGVRLEPFGQTSREEAVELFRKQISGLLQAHKREDGVDGFILETFSDINELHAAFSAIKTLSDLPVIAQMTIGEGGETSYGTSSETIAKTLTEWEVDVIGLNCSVGPATMLDEIERMAAVTDRPLSAQPNAGVPRTVGDRKMYLASPEYMAQYSRRLIDAGVRFVGGCCGTTPEHTKHLRDHVASVQPRLTHVDTNKLAEGNAPETTTLPLEERSKLGSKLASGEFIAHVEVIPSLGWRPDGLLKQCGLLKEAGADAVSVLDSPRAHSRMGVLSSASIVEREIGIETVVHYTCRDRNMPSMISDLLGAAAAGLRNLLIVSGDPPTMGPYPDATAVFDIDSIGLTNVVDRLNRGLDPGGNSIGEPTQYVIGVAVNHSAEDLDREVRRYGWKVEAGAHFAVTQPIFDPAALERFLELSASWRVPLLAGLWPLSSLRNAEFLANEIPGVHVPDKVIERMRHAQQSGAQAAVDEGIQIAVEMYEQVASMTQGVHISTPVSKSVDVARRVLSAVRPSG